MPPGDPDALESYASALASAAGRSDMLASSTARVTSGIRSNARWTGSAAEGYAALTSSLVQAVGSTVPQLNRIASAVREYAGYLRTAQEKVAAYNKAVEAASCLIPARQPAALAALEGELLQAKDAVNLADIAGDTAAGDVSGSMTIESILLQQQVQALDEQTRAENAPSGPVAEAAPPGWQQRAAAQARFKEWLEGSWLPPDPHTPEEPGGLEYDPNWDGPNLESEAP
jgi:uncharacterized protein YukE